MNGDKEMLSYKFRDPLVLCTGLKETKGNILGEKNADWYLFQISRDLTMTKNIYEQKVSNGLVEMILPKSLSQSLKPEHSLEEIRLYIYVIRSFIHYLEKTEQPHVLKYEKIRTVIENLDQRIRETTDEKLRKTYEDQRLKLVSDLKRNTHSLVYFVTRILSTRILVDEDRVEVFSSDEDLISYIDEELKKINKKITVVTKGDVEKW